MFSSKHNFERLDNFIDSKFLAEGSSSIICMYLSKQATIVKKFDKADASEHISVVSTFTLSSDNKELNEFETKYFGSDFDEAFSLIPFKEIPRITTSTFYCEICDKCFEGSPIAFEKYPEEYKEVGKKKVKAGRDGKESHLLSSKKKNETSVKKDQTGHVIEEKYIKSVAARDFLSDVFTNIEHFFLAMDESPFLYSCFSADVESPCAHMKRSLLPFEQKVSNLLIRLAGVSIAFCRNIENLANKEFIQRLHFPQAQLERLWFCLKQYKGNSSRFIEVYCDLHSEYVMTCKSIKDLVVLGKTDKEKRGLLKAPVNIVQKFKASVFERITLNEKKLLSFRESLFYTGNRQFICYLIEKVRTLSHLLHDTVDPGYTLIIMNRKEIEMSLESIEKLTNMINMLKKLDSRAFTFKTDLKEALMMCFKSLEVAGNTQNSN